MKNNIVGIICAMEKEVTHYKEIFKKIKETKLMNYTFFEASYNENKIIFTICGIGKVNAGSLTTLLIEHYHPDFIVNTGVAGGFDQSLKTLDIVVADKIFYHDVDCRFDNDARYGQVQGLPLFYNANVILNNRLSKLDINLKFGAIASGDQFITDYDKMKKTIDEYFNDVKVLACDMESCAIAQMCYLNHIEFIVIRAISDVVGSSQIMDYNTFTPQAASKAAKLILQLLDCEL